MPRGLSERLETFIGSIDEQNIAKLESMIDDYKSIDDLSDDFIAFYHLKGLENFDSIDKIIEEFVKKGQPLKKCNYRKSLPTPNLSLLDLEKKRATNTSVLNDEDEINSIYSFNSSKSNFATPILKQVRNAQQSFCSPNDVTSISMSTPITKSQLSGRWGSMEYDSKPFLHPRECRIQYLALKRHFMFQTWNSITNYLKNRVHSVSSSIQKNHPNIKQFHLLGNITHEDVYLFGRISSQPIDSKLSLDNCYLESTYKTEESNGIVKLRLAESKSFSIFRGQVVIVLGSHPSSNEVIVREIISNNPFINTTSPIPRSSLTGMILCGPYYKISQGCSLFINKLKNLLEMEKPQLCILIGPFIERNASNDTKSQKSLINEFKNLMEEIENLHFHSGIQIVIVPSTNDLVGLPLFPQPSFNLMESSKLLNVTNPCNMKVNNINFAVTSIDILYDMCSIEIWKGEQTNDRMARTIAHLINQRSFYPIYPPLSDSCLDFTRLEGMGTISEFPHVFVFASKVNPFVKFVDGVVCINLPPFYKEGQASDSYCRFYLQLSNNSIDASESIVEVRKI